MNDKVGLSSASGTPVALKSVHIEGVLHGLLATVSINQHYHNDSDRALEVVYTFPLARDATLLGMSVSWANRRLEGLVLEKSKAHERYENAIESGEASALLDRSGPGLSTVNLGTIAAGEKVMVELQYAQILRFENDLVHLRVPAVIAARDRDEHRDGGLAPHETTGADILAEYPLTLKLRLAGQASQAKVACPSHGCEIWETEGGKVVTLGSGATLDRDLCLTMSGMQSGSFAMLADKDGYTALACFQPAFPVSKSDRPLRVKIVLDCSDSMAGDGMATARRLLRVFLATLRPGDSLSYSRFGGSVRHEFESLQPWSPGLARRLDQLNGDAQADMGSTGLEKALLAVLFDVVMPDGPVSGQQASPPDVLLVTDGAVWADQRILAGCAQSGQRIFAIGVGSAPSDSLLRTLAGTSGGECLIVTPNEDGIAATTNMADRMRRERAQSLRIDWGTGPLWQSRLPAGVHPGHSVQVFASLKAPPRPPVLKCIIGGREQVCRAPAPERVDPDILVRLAGAERVKEAGTPEEATALALRYQLITGSTSLFLVHAEQGRRITTLPVLQQTPQMAAAGHAGFGSVLPARKDCDPGHDAPGTPSSMESADIPMRFVIKSSDPDYDPGSPLHLLQVFADDSLFLDPERTFSRVARMARRYNFESAVMRFRRARGLGVVQAWALLVAWLDLKSSSPPLPEQGVRRLHEALAGVSEEARNQFFSAMDTFYPHIVPPLPGKRRKGGRRS